jgi:hypothetical protein
MMTTAVSATTARAQGGPRPPSPSRAPAAGAPIVPLSASLTGEAKADYESARSLFEIADYNGALLKFRHAFEVSGDPRLLWNMAACEKEAHRYGRAVLLVERYLRESGARISAETRENASATLTALRGLSSHATLTGAPAGAHVLVDDEHVATTPLSAPLALDLGSHKVRLEHPEFEPFERTIEGVTGGGELTIAVAMTRLTGARLQIIAGPGDTITVDRKVVGAERWEGSVTPGNHEVHVTAAGKAPYDAVVALAPRGSRTVQVSLHAESKGAVWPWVLGGVAVVGGAVVGGYFLFKPKDEPGPYTAGGLGTAVMPAGARFQ